MIELCEATKRFIGFTAVNNLTLRVSRGEFFAFLGPNGAGKTTTIKMMTGLLKPTRGTIRLGEFDIEKQPEQAKRQIGYIPDSPYLYDKLTGYEFLRFVGDLYEIPVSEQERQIEKYLNLFSLWQRRDQYIEGYSHGMKQKIAMTAAFIHTPQIFIVDEPMVGLDPSSARLIKNILRQACIDGMTVFLSTHTLSVAEELANRIGILSHGSLIALGTIDELRNRSRMGNANLESVFLELTKDNDLAAAEAEYGTGESNSNIETLFTG